MPREVKIKYENLTDNIIRCVVNNRHSFLISTEDYERCCQYCWQFDGRYFRAIIGDKRVRLHRFILNDVEGRIDHINGDCTDNRRENLRPVTNQQNAWNSKKSKNNTTGYKGVSIDKRNTKRKYFAQIAIAGKNIHLGCFDNPKEAAKAYDKAASFYFGEYARLNFA